MPEETTRALAAAVREIEAHAAESGWDRPASALRAGADRRAGRRASPRWPTLLGLTADSRGLTPIDQELPADAVLEDALGQIMWPDGVAGCAAVVERLVLPPSADEHIPEDREAAASYAAEHPERQELRMVRRRAARRHDAGAPTGSAATTTPHRSSPGPILCPPS